MKLNVTGMDFATLNRTIRESGATQFTLTGVCGQRYLACASEERDFTLYGTPGNGLGHYMNGAQVEVFGNCQEAVGDTMNSGQITIHGSCGDACGYGMRGGRILIRDSVGYRAGIHMKAYEDHFPVLIAGGSAGSFLGEYLAGGLIAVLGRGLEGRFPAGQFCGTGMHGGKIILRCDQPPAHLPWQVAVRPMDDGDRAELLPHLEAWCAAFGDSPEEILSQRFFVLIPGQNDGKTQSYTFA